MIVEKTGADSFEIISDDDHYPYTYNELADVAKQEQNENAQNDQDGVRSKVDEWLSGLGY